MHRPNERTRKEEEEKKSVVVVVDAVMPIARVDSLHNTLILSLLIPTLTTHNTM
jgi:hypothetical protein